MRKSNDTCWVVSTGMQNDDRPGWSSIEVLTPPSKVQVLVDRVPVAIVLDVGVACVSEDEVVVAPGGRGDIDSVSPHDPPQELCSVPQSSCPTQGLDTKGSVLRQGWTVLTKQHGGGGLWEISQ